MNTNSGLLAPKHTFGEGVIVDGVTYNIGQWFFDKTGDDCWKIPFTDGDFSYMAIQGDNQPTLAAIRKAVIAQIKHLKKVGIIK
ncbi:MAG: hypothetical protein WC100_01770 [Sterolibacterium sp.]